MMLGNDVSNYLHLLDEVLRLFYTDAGDVSSEKNNNSDF